MNYLWTGLVAVAGNGWEFPMAGKSRDGGLVLLLPRISSISDPPLGNDFDLKHDKFTLKPRKSFATIQNFVNSLLSPSE